MDNCSYDTHFLLSSNYVTAKITNVFRPRLIVFSGFLLQLSQKKKKPHSQVHLSWCICMQFFAQRKHDYMTCVKIWKFKDKIEFNFFFLIHNMVQY